MYIITCKFGPFLDKQKDTLVASCHSLLVAREYMQGNYAPHYPVPATLMTTGFNHFHNVEHWWHWEWTKRRLFHDDGSVRRS